MSVSRNISTSKHSLLLTHSNYIVFADTATRRQDKRKRLASGKSVTDVDGFACMFTEVAIPRRRIPQRHSPTQISIIPNFVLNCLRMIFVVFRSVSLSQWLFLLALLDSSRFSVYSTVFVFSLFWHFSRALCPNCFFLNSLLCRS
jgi:hypothetical protein